MAGERKGPRQPVSRVRPGKAQSSKKPGGPPPSSRSPAGRKPPAAKARSDHPNSGRAGSRTASPVERGAAPAIPRKAPAAKAPRPATRGKSTAKARASTEANRRPPAPPAETYRRLSETYPDAHCALHHENAYQLLVATILSAQCTDARVNIVTPALFARFPDARTLANAQPEELEELIRSTGFFRSKTKSLIGMAQGVVERHGGEIPDTMESLTELPGVGRKTANVILGNAFGKNEGVVVDTHVTRLSNRLGFTAQQDPVKIEQDLVRQFPREQWTLLSHLLIDHGRAICVARAPKCPVCPLADLCPSALV